MGSDSNTLALRLGFDIRPKRASKEQQMPRKVGYEFFKRMFDISLVMMSLPVVLPIALMCAAIIKVTSPGAPVMFVQKRTGRNGKRFKMYKFRTMVPNAEAMKAELLSRNELTWPDFKLENDPRITPFGGLMRKTSLDELPQLLNVLLGDMSIVGPRPTSFDASTYSLWHSERLEVRPGITGLWQVAGRGRIDFDDRVRLDIAYIENRSFLFDLMLLFRTFTVVFRGS